MVTRSQTRALKVAVVVTLAAPAPAPAPAPALPQSSAAVVASPGCVSPVDEFT